MRGSCCSPRVPAEPHSAAGHTAGTQRTSTGGLHKATSPAVPGANHSPGRGQAGAPPWKKTIRWSLVRSYTASTRSSCSGRPRQKRCTCAGCRDTSCRSRVSRQKYLPGGTDGVAAAGGLGPTALPPTPGAGPAGLTLEEEGLAADLGHGVEVRATPVGLVLPGPGDRESPWARQPPIRASMVAPTPRLWL